MAATSSRFVGQSQQLGCIFAGWEITLSEALDTRPAIPVLREAIALLNPPPRIAKMR